MSSSLLHLLPLTASSPLSPSVSLVKFVDGEWVLDEPQFVLAVFLDVTALECQLPLEDSRTPADPDFETATNTPLARWQIKVSHIYKPFLVEKNNPLTPSSLVDAGFLSFSFGQRKYPLRD